MNIVAFDTVFLLYIPLALLMGAYLLRNKRYHPILDAFLVLFGIVLYSQFIPFLGIPPLWFKYFLFGTGFTDYMSSLTLLSYIISELLFLASAIILLTEDILTRFVIFAKLTKKSLISAVCLLLSVVVLSLLSLFHPVYLLGTGIGGGTNGAASFSHIPQGSAFNLTHNNTTVSRDPRTGLFVYRITAKNQLNVNAEIVGLSVLEMPNNSIFSIFPEKHQLAPPFGTDINITGGQNTGQEIIVNPAAIMTLKIFSETPFLRITLMEKRNNYEISFASPFPPVSHALNISLTEALDPNVKLFLSNSLPPTSSSIKTSFASGEPFWPLESGLAQGTMYEVVIANLSGTVVFPTNNSAAYLVSVKTGQGMEGYGGPPPLFNFNESPLAQGSYKAELVKVEGGAYIVVAYTNFSVT